MKRKDQYQSEKNQKPNDPVINSHFIANTLNAIENLIQTDQKQEALKYFSHFSHFTRILLNTPYGHPILLAADIKTLRHFLALTYLRFRNIEYTLKIAPDIRLETLYVPALVLQSYIEDTIWQHLKPKPGNSHLAIEIRRQEDKLLFILEDDGISQAQAIQVQIKKTSIPQERLHTIRAFEQIKVEKQAILDVNGNICGTRTQIQLPITKVKSPGS